MAKDLSFLPFFLTEELFILPEDRPVKAPGQAPGVPAATASGAAASTTTAAKPVPAIPKAAVAVQASQNQETQAKEAKPAANPHLIFGKNQKKLLILVEDHNNAVMERADGLLLKDILKAVDYSFDDVAIVNIAHCRQEADWQTINEIPYQRLFSFGIKHPQIPATIALAPYELESSGNRKFLLTDNLSTLRSDRSRKIALWNLLKQVFV